MASIRREVLEDSVVEARPVLDTAQREYLALLNANSYQKGGYILSMLHGQLGDSAFFGGVRAYYAAHRDGNALTDDLRCALERASGQDLRQFFDQWLRRPGVAEPRIGWAWDAARGTITLLVLQPSDGAAFELPLPSPSRRHRARSAASRWPSRRRHARRWTLPGRFAARPALDGLRSGPAPARAHPRAMIAPAASLFALVLGVSLAAPAMAGAQWARSPLPRSRGDVLLDAGLWPQAEEAYYAQSGLRPRAPAPRAALGRYLAMKGAVLPGTILIEEAMQFGLDSATGRAMLRPWRAVLEWRGIARIRADSTLLVRRAEGFDLAVPAAPAAARRRRYRAWEMARHRVGRRRAAGDRVGQPLHATPRVGVELIEALVPSLDVATMRLTLHADARTALASPGTRYPLLRDARDVRVLMTSAAPSPSPRRSRSWRRDGGSWTSCAAS